MFKNLVESLPRIVMVKTEKGAQNLEWNVQKAHMGIISQVLTYYWPCHVL